MSGKFYNRFSQLDSHTVTGRCTEFYTHISFFSSFAETNRRTADVRSVGYSELFSLSRDDVLAATTDYPEAREILQALGRKRLMEVRSINKKHAKHVSERESIASKSFKHHDDETF